MTETNTGGPAFPYVYDDPNKGVRNIQTGMTLRDYFAAKAMQGFLANPEAFEQQDEDTTIADTYAREAYVYADAMLKARDGK